MEREIRFCINDAGEAIAYTVFGNGSPLVVPPGWVSHLEQQWKLPGVSEFFRKIARNHRLLLFDKQGTGLSDRNRQEFTLEKDVRDLEAVVDAAGLTQFAVFGFSMGGPLAISYAARHPDQVERLILYGTFADGTVVSRGAVRDSMIALVRANWGMGANLLSWLFVPHKSGDPDAVEKITAFQKRSASAETAANLLELFHRINVTDLLPRLDLPTLVIHRRGDRPIPAIHGQKLAAAIPGARFLLMDGDIHFPWLGDTDPLLAAIGEFLGDAPLQSLETESYEHDQSPEAERVAPETVSKEPASGLTQDRESRSYRFVYHDLLDLQPGIQQESSRVGVAQIHMDPGLLVDRGDGLLGLGPDGLDVMKRRIEAMIDQAARHRINILAFPEMTFDLGHEELSHLIFEAARAFGMYIVPGSFHDPDTRRNVSRIIGPEGILWEQEKHIPAMISLGGKKIREQIATRAPGKVVVANTRFGRVAVVICRDFLDMDLRVELKNFTPAVDIVINPAFTPVTQDFEAAHLEARRSVYAYFFFCNVAAFGNSLVHSPEKGRKKRGLPPNREGLIFKDIDLFNLRSERRKWEKIREEKVRFIQSTR